MRGKALFTAFVFGCASLCATQPGLAASEGGDLLKSMEKGGWQTVAPGVMQRNLGQGKIETLGFGADGLRFKIQEMKDHLSFLRQEYTNHPTPNVRKSIRTYKAEIARLTQALETIKSLDEEEGLKALSEKASGGIDCTIKYGAHVNAFPLTGSSSGVGSTTDSYFNSNCGQTGEVYAHSYSKATGVDNVIRTATHTDPTSGVRTGSNVTASTSDSVIGVRDCYSYSYATLTSYDIGVSYSQSVENRLCPVVSPPTPAITSAWGGYVEVYGTSCTSVTWNASATGGTSPYSFAWYNGSTYLGAGTSYTRSFCGNNTTKTQFYNISVTVTDSASQSKSATYANTIYYYGSSTCLQQTTADGKAIAPICPVY